MSKGLEALTKIEKELAKAWGMDIAYDNKVFDLFHIVGKELQAFEIIKNKKVDVKYLYYRAEFNVEKYNDNYIVALTKEECDLLKEVLA